MIFVIVAKIKGERLAFLINSFFITVNRDSFIITQLGRQCEHSFNATFTT